MAEIIDHIDIDKIRDQELCFLFGAGASSGLFPTLATEVKDEKGNWETIETLAQYFESIERFDLKTLLFMYYYENCIAPVMSFDWLATYEKASLDDGYDQVKVIQNYEVFLTTLLNILETKNEHDKTINLFTTNYDSCFIEAFEELQKYQGINLTLNDGTDGFKVKTLEARNFDSVRVRKSIFDKSQTTIPQINIIHLHGSAYWRKNNDKIEIQYDNQDRMIELSSFQAELDVFTEIIEKKNAKRDDFIETDFGGDWLVKSSSFWDEYNKLPIVNPTKWKFHETVFEEHYYQMLRYMSYILDKKNITLITFGFSFADEHIRNLLKRALNNKHLTMYVCCFRESHIEKLKEYFKGCNNVKYIAINGELNFDVFNETIFTLNGLI
ncbi:SIR2 family protein [Providencia rettgeri]|uniref:SIR2 family protein n=1 Tax=Providencia rettgeri TaxID=587 RepID=UPI00300FF780